MFKLLLLSAQLFLFTSAYAQQTNELVIQVPGVEQRNYNQVYSLISEVQHIKITHYCDKQDIFLIQLEREVMGSHDPIDQITERMKSLGFSVFVKEGRTHREIISEDACIEAINTKE